MLDEKIIKRNVKVINALIDEMESEGFDFVKRINEEMKKKCFMWTLCEWSITPSVIKNKYIVNVLKLATLWALAENEEISDWARYSSEHGVLLSKFQFMKTFGTYDYFIKFGNAMKESFTAMISEDASLEYVQEDER